MASHEPQTVNSISVASSIASSPDAAGSEAAGAATPAQAASSAPDESRAECCKKRRLLNLCDCMWVSFACGYDIEVRPVGAGQVASDVPLPKKSAQAACEAMIYPARIESILCNQRILSNWFRRFRRGLRGPGTRFPGHCVDLEELQFASVTASKFSCGTASGMMTYPYSPRRYAARG